MGTGVRTSRDASRRPRAAGSREIADFSAPARARAGRRYPVVALHEDPRDLIADPTVDAVIIATPVATHFDLAAAALRAGKHVMVEKPITACTADAKLLIDEAARRRLVLMVDHTFVYTGAVQKIGEIIRAGALGDVYYYDSTRVNLGLFQQDVNVIWDLASMTSRYLTTCCRKNRLPSRRVERAYPRAPGEHGPHLPLLQFGTVAHLNVNWLAPVKVRQTLIGGSRQMVVWNDLEPSEKVKVYDRGVTLGEGVDPTATRIAYRSGDMWAPQLLGQGGAADGDGAFRRLHGAWAPATHQRS